MIALDAAVSGREQEIHCPVAIDVADADGIEAKRVTGNAAGDRAEQAAVLP